MRDLTPLNFNTRPQSARENRRAGPDNRRAEPPLSLDERRELARQLPSLQVPQPCED